MNRPLKKFNYHYKGGVVYGPIYGFNKEDAKNRERESIRKTLKNPKAKLPIGFKLWEIR
jgi:hypothetical protein